MNKLLYFFLGGMVFISVAAATTSVMSVKPAKPIDIISMPFWDYDQCNKIIQHNSKKGYVLKMVTSTQSRYSTISGLVIMEKY